MEKNDLIIEFVNLINEIEQRFMNQRFLRHESIKNEFESRTLNNEPIEFDMQSELINFQFNYQVSLSGYLCDLKMKGTIRATP